MTDFWGRILHLTTLARGCRAHGRQKRIMKRGGQCFDKSQHIKQPGHGRAGLAFTDAPLAKGEHGDAQIIGGFAFVKVQAVHGVTDPSGEGVRGGVRAGRAGLSSGCHGVGFYGVRKTRHGAGSGVTGLGIRGVKVWAVSTVRRDTESGQARRGIPSHGCCPRVLRTISR